MNPIIVYMLKAAFYLAAFYAVYSCMLSKDTLYGRNRAFIILSVLTSLLLPFITIHTGKPLNFPVFGKVLSEVFVIGGGKGFETGIDPIISGKYWAQAIWMAYLTGVVLFAVKLIIDLLELVFLILRQPEDEDGIIRFSGFSTAGFSAMGHVFINSRLTDEEAVQIIRHEQNHIDRNHFSDIVFIEAVKVLQWFNPVIYLFNSSLRAVHEYQADEECIKSGLPVVTYQRMLLNQVFRTNIFTITNSFSNPALIKKRMIMMTKKRSRAMANLKLFALLPVVAAVMLIFSTCSESGQPVGNPSMELAAPPPPPPPPVTSKSAGAEPYIVVEEMPMFPGGEVALLKFIGENTQYPELAKTQGVQGRVIVRFAVGADGKVTLSSVLKGVDPALDAEALRVVNTLPDFQPGKQSGVAVPVWYMVPITFTLK
ncbi:MAG: M56 family metallopeptidase [Bacteroidales bacterium]